MWEAQLLRNWQKATIISKAAVEENIINTSETSFKYSSEERNMESDGNEGSTAVEINKVNFFHTRWFSTSN